MAFTFPTTNLGGSPNNCRLAATINIGDITVSGNLVSIPAFSYSLGIGIYNTYEYPQAQTGVYGNIYADVYINNINFNRSIYCSISGKKVAESKSWANVTASGNHAALTNVEYTSRFFNSSNPTAKTVPISIKRTWVSAGCDMSQGDSSTVANLNGSANLILNAPPTFTNDPMIFDTQGVFVNVTTASVHVDDITAYYGGYIKEAKLTIGNQTAILTGDATSVLDECILSIKLDTIGTFTPVLTVTDSRNQIKTINLADVTVVAGADTTFDSTQVSSDTPGFYAAKSAASVTISNISVPYGGSISSTKLVIGNQEISGSGAGTLQIALDTVGTFTPVVSVTDSWGRTYSKTLNDITVKEYFAPGISLDIDRAASDGTIDEESTSYVLVTMPFTYTRDVATFAKPTLKVGLQEQNVTWYESWDNINGVDDPITSWTNYHPASPSTIYALVPGTYSLVNTYDVYVTAHDSNGKDSEEISQKVPLAFFTMDFLAGGHGIAFGQMSTEEGFFCNMDAHYKDKANVMRALFDFVRPVGSAYSTTDPNFDPNVTWGGTWEKLPEGYVLLSGSDSGSYIVGDDSGTSSGYKEYGENTHTLTANEIPAHTHGNKSLTGSFSMRRGGSGNTQNIWANGIMSVSAQAEGSSTNLNFASQSSKADRININASHEHDSVGGSQAHSIMQKSIAVYWWIRTA